jgi:hypothetical protein
VAAEVAAFTVRAARISAVTDAVANLRGGDHKAGRQPAPPRFERRTERLIRANPCT